MLTAITWGKQGLYSKTLTRRGPLEIACLVVNSGQASNNSSIRVTSTCLSKGLSNMSFMPALKHRTWSSVLMLAVKPNTGIH